VLVHSEGSPRTLAFREDRLSLRVVRDSLHDLDFFVEHNREWILIALWLGTDELLQQSTPSICYVDLGSTREYSEVLESFCKLPMQRLLRFCKGTVRFFSQFVLSPYDKTIGCAPKTSAS